MQTGQPGPMTTFRSSGNELRRPNRAIACSWLPQTCITETGERPISRTVRASADESAAARAGSRNFSSAAPASLMGVTRTGGRDLSADVGRHQVGVGLAEQTLVHVERALHVLRGDLPDGEADVIEDVVTRLDRLVGELEAHLPAYAEEVHLREIA